MQSDFSTVRMKVLRTDKEVIQPKEGNNEENYIWIMYRFTTIKF